MSEDSGRKTEEPTDRRIEQAREDGEIARSRDLSTVTVLAAVLLGIAGARDWLLDRLRLLGRIALEAPARLDPDDPWTVIGECWRILWLLFELMAPVALIAALAAIIVNAVQAGGLFAPKAVLPQVERLDPMRGLTGLVSPRSLIEVLKSTIKMALVALALYLVIRVSIDPLVRLPSLPVPGAATLTWAIFASFFGAGLTIFALIAVFDVWFQRHDYRRRMRMTLEEVKRERRDQEGDPRLRARRRAIARELAGESGLERTARASLVIRATGSTCAVAIAFDPGRDGQPWLIHKGRNQVAAAIAVVAAKAGVRIIDDARLAEAVYREAAIDEDLPPKLATAVRTH